MANAIDVAAYILDLIGNATTMKLQKLVYYSQARHLVVYGSPLFNNKIEAWANGPVIPDLFREHSGQYLVRRGDIGSPSSASSLSADQKASIRNAVDLFGQCSGEQLREITHNESPWLDARGRLSPGARCCKEIPIDSIRRYYSSPTCSNPVSRPIDG